jgi:acyl-CoA-binding protein
MNSCPFCGSRAVEWPKFASEYVKGYSLCEYHMGLALSKSHRVEFDSPEHHEAIKYNKMCDELAEFIEGLVEKNHGHASGLCPVAEKFYWDAYSGVKKKPLENPTKEYIDEVALDLWVAQRLKSLAHEKDGRVHRCSVYKEGSPDHRCTNRTYDHGGVCEPCAKASPKNRIGGLDDPKVIAALRLLRSSNESHKIAA